MTHYPNGMPIDPATGATFKPPNHFNYASIKKLHTYLRKSCPKQYRGMQGRVFFFAFATSSDRDIFMKELQEMIERRGNEVRLDNVTN